MLIFLVALILGTSYICFIRNDAFQQEKEKALLVANSVAACLSIETLDSIPQSLSDIRSSAFPQIKEILKQVIAENKNTRFSYLYIQRNSKLYFLVDSEPEFSPDYSPSGQEFTEADPLDWMPFQTGRSQITPPVSDRWGTWVSAEVPVKNASGQIIAVLGMDYDAKSWRYRIWRETTESSLLVIFVLLVIFAFIFNKRKNRMLLDEVELRKNTDQKLKQLSRAVEQNPVSIVITDAKGIIVYVNPRFTEMTGYEGHEALGQNPRILKSGKMDNAYYNNLWSTIKTGSVWKGEIINKRKSGELYWANKTISAIFDKKGNILNYVAIGEEITDRKRIEEELIRAKEKAEESDRLKSAFLANISHEIRTPMNGILGFADLLKSPNLSSENQMEFIEMIEKSGQRMLSIINDLIDISKIEAGETVLRIKQVGINQMLREIHSFFVPETNRKNISFEFYQELSEKSEFMKTDEVKLNQILTNLIKNAIKFTESGSITFGYNSKDSSIIFFVTDTGHGIPPNQKELIFERFRQSSLNNKRNFEGAGLGLAISKAYVEMLGGTIDVESEWGKGSTFRFSLPLNHDEIITPNN